MIDKEQALKILSDLIAFDTVNSNEVKVALYLQKLFKKYNIDSEIIEIKNNRANLVAEIGTGHPVLVASGHMDVVSPGNLKEWTSDPFKLTERDGILYGRGVTDMKAGLAAMVIAMIEMHQEGLPKQGTIRLLATIGEEVGEEGSRAFLESGYMKDTDGLIIGEPSTIYSTASKQKGSFDIKFISKGQSVHSSTPEKGWNALVSLMQLLMEAKQEFDNISEGEMGRVLFNIDILKGGNQVNSIPDSAEAEVNIRTIPEYNNTKVAEMIKQLIEKYNSSGAQISTEVIMDESPIAIDENNKMVELIRKIGPKYAKNEIDVIASPGITDASNLAQNKPHDFPFAVYGPGDMTQHQVNESLPKQMYFDFINLYQELFVDFLDQK